MTKAADVYGFSMLSWELFTGQQLFQGLRQSQVRDPCCPKFPQSLGPMSERALMQLVRHQHPVSRCWLTVHAAQEPNSDAKRCMTVNVLKQGYASLGPASC